MKPTVRIFIICLTSFVLLIGAAIGIGIYKPKSYEGLYNWLLYENTGYRFTIEEISIQFLPTRVFVKGLELKNPEWGSNPYLLRLGSAEVKIELSKFISNQLPYWSAVLNDSVVYVAEDELGNLNWETSVLDNQETKIQESLNLESIFSFSEISIEKLNVKYVKTESVKEIEFSSLSLQRTDERTVQLQGLAIYEMERIDIEGEVGIDDKELSGQTLQFKLQATGLDVDLQAYGQINPQNTDGASAYLTAKSHNLDKFERYLKRNIPDVEPVDISVELTSSKGTYEASKIQLQLGENIIYGDILFNTKDNSIRANLTADRLDFTPYMTVVDELTKDENHTTIKGNSEIKISSGEDTVEEPELNWTWMKSFNPVVNLKVGKIIANQHSIHDLSLAASLEDETINIHSLKGRYEQTSQENHEHTIKTDVVEITGTMQPLENRTQGKDILISLLISEGDSKMVLNGNVNLNGVEGTALKIDAKATSLDSLAQYLQQDFSPFLPASVSANIESFYSGIKVTELVARSKKSDLSGDMNIDWSNEIVNINGNFSSQLLDLSPLHQLGKGSDQTSIQQEDVIVEDKIFSDEEIDWAWLSWYDINLDVEVNKLVVPTVLSGIFGEQAPDNIFHNVITKFELNGGELNIDPIQAHLAGGNINGTILLKKIEDEANLDMKFDALNISMEALGATGDNLVDGGITDIVVDFSGQGKSAHQIVASLNGEFVLEIQEATVDNNVFELIGTDLFLELVNTLSPFVKKSKTTEIECLALKFTAEDGVLSSRKQMAVETSRMKIVGSGKIDMHTENIAIGFTPIAKKGIGVNIGNVVKFVYLGGTLGNPKIENNPLGIVESGATVTSAIATGGLSLIAESLFQRVIHAGSLCNKALEDPEADLEEK